MYNLYVGSAYKSDTKNLVAYGDEATGLQNSMMKGLTPEYTDRNGTTAFSTAEQKGTNFSDYSGSIVEGYVNNYKELLESTFDLEVKEARIPIKSELVSDTFNCSDTEYSCANSPYSWIYSTTYWVYAGENPNIVWCVTGYGQFNSGTIYGMNNVVGVRPVIIISKEYFN